MKDKRGNEVRRRSSIKRARREMIIFSMRTFNFTVVMRSICLNACYVFAYPCLAQCADLGDDEGDVTYLQEILKFRHIFLSSDKYTDGLFCIVGLQLMCYKRKKVTDKPSCVTVKLNHLKQTQKRDIGHEHCNT